MPYSSGAQLARTTEFGTTPPAGLLGLLAAPGIPRQTLLAALSELPSSQVASLLERIASHGVDGLAFRALSRLPRTAVDPWLHASLKRRYQRCSASTLVQGMAMAEVLNTLTTSGIPAVVIGGLRSVESIYGDAGSRPIDRHDLLVQPGDRQAAAAALHRLGLRPSTDGRFRRGGMLLELSMDAFGLRPRSRSTDASLLPTRDLMERASPGLVAGASSLILDPEDELLVLAIQLVRYAFDRLIRIADVAHWIAAQNCALRWDVLRERGAAYGVSRMLGLALESTTLLGIAAPWEGQMGGPTRSLERLLIRRARALRPRPLTGALLLALSAPDARRGLRFIVDALLPSSASAGAGGRRPAVTPCDTVVPFREKTGLSKSRRGARWA